jgi:hypothetical protein
MEADKVKRLVELLRLVDRIVVEGRLDASRRDQRAHSELGPETGHEPPKQPDLGAAE